MQKICEDRILAASDLFDMFTQPIKFCTFHCHILKATGVWTSLRPEKPEIAFSSLQQFQGKMWVSFWFNTKHALSQISKNDQ